MATLIDARFDALRATYTGAVNDMLLQWLQAGGATSSNLVDAWMEMLESQLGVEYTGNRSDDWYTLLGNLGFTGARNDRETAFWVAGGIL